MINKTYRKLRTATILAFAAAFSHSAWSAPYPAKGLPVRWTQPDGTTLKLRVFGDDLYGRTETLDGYTVVYNEKTRAYHYAKTSGSRLRLLPTDALAHKAPPGGLDRHIDRSPEGILKVRMRELAKRPVKNPERWKGRVEAARQRRAGIRNPAPSVNPAPVLGSIRGLTILAQFPDDDRTNRKDPVDFPTSRSKIVRFCNNTDYSENGNAGSVRDYFFEQSGGKLTYTQTVTDVVTLPHPRAYYNFEDYPANTRFRDAGTSGNLLLTDAIGVLKSEGFDFSGLTVDAIGDVLATNIFFAGPDSGVWAAGLWPHQSSLLDTVDVGVGRINAYQITNLEDNAPVIGTFCHENGHLICDFPDLYSYVDTGSIGNHCLMSSGNYNDDGKTPAPINAHLKDVVGWANIVELSPTDYVRRTLPTTGNVAYRIRKPGQPTESFVVENRGNGDPWAKYAVDKGIMIWHIDETIEGNANRLGTDPHYGVALVQADGRTDLENGLNRGDGGDLFEKGDLLASTTRPNSDWWDGSSSDVRVKILGNPSKKVAVQFGPLPPDTIIVTSPNGGEVLYRSSSVDIKWEANVIGDLKIDLLNGSRLDTVITRSTANDGQFTWKVPENQAAGTDYSIRISTITNPTPVSDKSDDQFAVTDATFPVANRLPYGWYTPKEADSGWKVSKSKSFEGKYCLSTKETPDAGMCAVAYKSNFLAGRVSFYIKVSSEVSYDNARFYIDGVPQKIRGTSKGISGIRDWQFVSVPLSAGKHTLMWTYEKDDSYGDGKDKVWLDAVELPATKQEIEVISPNGKSLVSKTSSYRFRSTKIGKVSDPRTFTIQNTGKADLHGLALELKGSSARSFRVGKLSKSSLKPGQKARFKVRFAPDRMGKKFAKLRVMSNDVDESPFVIELKGTGRGLPEVEVYQPRNHRLVNKKETMDFGIARVGTEGETIAFRVRNAGTAPLDIRSIDVSGSDRRDFAVGNPGKRTLAPLEATTFKVTFNPGKKNLRNAKLTIHTSDRKNGPFIVNLKGKGAPKRRASSRLSALASGSDSGASAAGVEADVSVVFVDGVKYRTLTVDKESVPSNLKPVVEVSGNLVDWFRGARHTTVVEDNAAILKVRDNTPLEPGVKRHIRLRTLER